MLRNKQLFRRVYPLGRSSFVREDSMARSVSVIMTVYNGQDHLETAISSLLRQTFGDFEVVIVDDGSTDESAKILRAFEDPRLRVLHREHVGRTSALRLAFEHAAGIFVAVLDADDVSQRMRLEKQVDYLEQHPDTVLVSSWYDEIDNAGDVCGHGYPPTDHQTIINQFACGNPLAHSTVMYRRTVAKHVGGYPPQFAYAQDFGLYLRLALLGKLAVLPESLVQLRRGRASMSTVDEYLLDRAFDRVRLVRAANSLPGVSPGARRKGRCSVTTMSIKYGDALCASGRSWTGTVWLAKAFLRQPRFTLMNKTFQNRVFRLLPGMNATMRGIKRGVRVVASWAKGPVSRS